MENPILHNALVRQHYIYTCVLLGAAYALSFGFPYSTAPVSIAADALISSLLFYCEAAIFWSIFTYSHIEVVGFYRSIAVHIAYALLSVALMLFFEYLALSLCVSESIPAYLRSLSGRAFCIVIIYVLFRKYYNDNMYDEDREIQTETLTETNTDMQKQAELIERITVKVGTKIKVIAVDDIIYFKAEDDYVSVVTSEGHWLKSERMKDYEESLPGNMFARVHRSYIVNISKISKIERYGQKQMLSLNNGEQIRISMTGYKVLREKLNL